MRAGTDSAVRTHRLMLVEREDEEVFCVHTMECQADLCRQQGLRCPAERGLLSSLVGPGGGVGTAVGRAYIYQTLQVKNNAVVLLVGARYWFNRVVVINGDLIIMGVWDKSEKGCAPLRLTEAGSRTTSWQASLKAFSEALTEALNPWFSH